MAETRYEIGVLNYHCSTYESAIDFLNSFKKHKSGQPICVFYGSEDTEWRVLFAVGSSETDGTKYNILGEVAADDINEKIQWFSLDDEENIKTDGNTLRLVHDLTGDDDLDSLMSNNENVLFVGEGGGIGCIYHNGTLFSSPYIEDKILKEDLTIGETTYEAGSTLTSIIQDILEKINPDNVKVDWDNIENKPAQVEDAFDCDSFMKKDENLSDLANKQEATQNLLSGLDGVANNTVLKFEDGAIKWGSTIIGWYDEDGNLKPGSGVKFVNISREEYNQLTTPPETTLYFVHEGSGTAEEYELYIGGHSLRTNSYHIAEAGETPEDVKKRYALTDSEGSVCGDYIDIPKDKFISHAELRTVTEPDVPYEGANVGDEYIDLEIMNCEEHIYIPLGDIDAPQADWNEDNSDSGAFIMNKPTIKAGQGENSIIEGDINNNVAGNFSHAEGSRTTASGSTSHAEGGGTTASGSTSHAEGGGTKALGSTSHAEGSGTTASGYGSHAEGGGTTASGSTSHAEGGGTKALGSTSHAEGSGTTASGSTSHAEGGGTTASGSTSHAEGNNTTASGDSSHAEGGNTTASGPTSHAEGGATTASSYCSHAEGGGTTASGPQSHAEGINSKASGAYSHAEGGGTTASGSTSHAEGSGTKASGASSHAEGSSTTATGDSSHTEGNGTIANNKCQHVFGEYNVLDPSTASSDARGNYVEIVGNGTDENTRSNVRTLDWSGNETLAGNLTIGGTITANGGQILPQKQADWNQTTSTESDYIINKPAIKAGLGENSIIEGNLVQNSATGKCSHTEGSGTTASGNYGSHAEGGVTTASGPQSHAEGYYTTASGPQSHAEGGATTASGNYSHTEGYNTIASGASSHAEGSGTKASGDYSHTEGYYTTASGSTSHAEGTSTRASGASSHAEGSGTKATGASSHAEGSSTTATGDSSHTEGNGTIANNKCQHVFGEYNGVDPSSALSSARGTYIEIVGNGTIPSARSNARTLDWSGNETLAGNLTIGGTITANGGQILPQKQADWSQTTSTGSDYIKNKPTKLSDFINDGEGGTPTDPFVTESDVDEIRDVISNGATSQNKLITQSEAQELVNVLSLSPIMADSSGAKSFDFESPVYGALVSGSTNLEAGPWYKNEGNGFEVCNSTTGVYVSLNDSAVVIDDESLFFYFAHGYRYQRIKMGVQGVYGKIKTPYGETVDLNYTDGSTLSGKFANTPCIYFYDDNNMFGHSGRVIYVCRATNLVSKTNAAEEYLVGASGTINDIMQGTDPDNTYDLVYPTTKYVCTQAQTASTDPVWAYRVTISESSSLADVAFTGSYADLQNTPKKLSDFTNDGNGDSPLNPFVTRNELEATPAEWDYIMGN